MNELNQITVAVTPPSGHSAIADRATRDLGFSVNLKVLPTENLYQTALLDPEAFDLIQVEFWMINNLRDTGHIQPIAAAEIERFNEILPLFTEGRVGDVDVSGLGAAPRGRLFADDSKLWLNAVPTICNSDTLGWRRDRVSTPVTSWGDLFRDDLHGRVALADVPAVSHLELSLALQAQGLVTYADIGNQTRSEIDASYEVLMRKARDGHFQGLWPSFEMSVEQMTEGEVALQSLWPPAVTALRLMDVPVVYEPLAEGARGWAGGFCLSSKLTVERRAAVLKYINWYLSGWAGAYLTRQGYYPSAPQSTRKYLSEDEWSYWQCGGTAKQAIKAPNGTIIGRPGTHREGGSYEARMAHIACWSTDMDEDEYVRSKWREFRMAVDAGARHAPNA